MDSFVRIVIAVLFAVGALGFFSVLWVVPVRYKALSRRLALAMRTLSCVIGCGYLVAAYIEFRDGISFRFFAVILACSFLNLIVLAVERPWSRRGQPVTTPHD
jgi:UDP-N-acetylmuramyl pentapeptide phosphotransferase/UDP-N-acetylglucosamine-1-phosphate transferase